MPKKIVFDDRVYFQSDVLNESGCVSHCFTSKCGGVSCGTVKGLNLGYRVGDKQEAVDENYRLVAGDFGFDFSRITAGRQTHSSNIRIITESDAGKGVSRESEFENVDGLVTNVKGLPLVVYYADCVPILLVDETAGVIAAVHSGWRGTVAKIVKNAVDIMISDFGADSEKIKAAIGPSIGLCCFETGEEVACQFDDSLLEPWGKEKFKVDLQKANENILLSCGLAQRNVDVLKICTVCNNDILYSYRMEKEATGRMGAFISLQ
ncbi:MAG: peptidoglycan editing factor PgeF [Clostridia bacterium]|nr:peptidoglycan editing factor PgeF [Clostridia bacterium]